MASNNFLGTPSDFSRLGQVSTALDKGWARIPTYYYDVAQHSFPLTATEFGQQFGATIKVFNLDESVPGRQTNAATGSGLNEPFLAMGVGVVAIGEGEAFTTPGALIDAPGSAGVPAFNGAAPINGDNTRNATLWWGGATWDFIEKFFQAYRLQVLAARRWLLVDEALFDVGMTPVPPEFVGASNSNIPVMPFIRETNTVLSDKNFGKAFIPQNCAGSLAVGAPTAGVTYGHPRIIGLGNRLYCFNNPILMLPGMTFDTKFVGVENDRNFRAAMARDSILSTAVSDNVPVPGAAETIVGVNGYSTSFSVPGGTVSIGLVFKGYALHPKGVVDYVQNYLAPDSSQVSMYAGNPYLSGLAGQVRGGNLAGIASKSE